MMPSSSSGVVGHLRASSRVALLERFRLAMVVVDLEGCCVCGWCGGRKEKGKDSKQASKALCAVASIPCQGWGKNEKGLLRAPGFQCFKSTSLSRKVLKAHHTEQSWLSRLSNWLGCAMSMSMLTVAAAAALFISETFAKLWRYQQIQVDSPPDLWESLRICVMGSLQT